MTIDVARARRLEAPTWINIRTILGLILFLIAFLSGQRLLATADETVGVWAAARDLPSGEMVTAADLDQVQVQMPAELLSLYATSLARLEGTKLLHPVRAGELVALESVGSAGPTDAGRSITIPVTPDHAVGATLRVGDRIDVFATFDADDVRARTVIVVRGAEIVGTVASGGLITGEEATVGVTVAATPQEAARLAFAIRSGDIDIARIDVPLPPARLDPIDAGSFR